MKCVQNIDTFQVRRLPDKEASVLVETELWVYIPKNIWKLEQKKSLAKRAREAQKEAS